MQRPHLWCSAAPGGSGLGFEKAAALQNGIETSSLEPAAVHLHSKTLHTVSTFDADAPRAKSELREGQDAAYEGRSFQPGYNAYDLARQYAKEHPAPADQATLRIQFHCGTTCFNCARARLLARRSYLFVLSYSLAQGLTDLCRCEQSGLLQIFGRSRARVLDCSIVGCRS